MKNLILILLLLVLRFSTAQDLSQTQDLINNYQFEKALAILTSALDSTDVRIPLQRGYCYYRLGNFKYAIQSYYKALQLDSVNRTALFQLGQLYSRNNRFSEAKMCYERLIRIDSTSSYYFKQYASLATTVSDVPLAIDLFHRTLTLNPNDLEAYSLLGNILLDTEQFSALDSLLSRGLSIDSLQSSLLLLKAKSQMGQQQYKRAVATVGKLMTKNDTIPSYARLLGISYFQLSEYKKVIQCMNFLLNADQKNDWIYYYLGVSYRELNDLPRSIENMNKAIEEGITDNIGAYYSQLAKAYEDKKDYKNAIHFYHAAYEKSKSKILLYHLARNYDVYYKDKSTAIAYYRQYLASSDTIRIAKEYSRHRLNALEDN
jgi:tetratricopeptide (TPR) repeat protein